MAQGLIRTGTATTSSALLVPQRSNRRAIVLFAPASGNYTISDSPNITAVEGVYLVAGQPPVTLDQTVVGDLVKQALYVLGSASISFGFVEVLD